MTHDSKLKLISLVLFSGLLISSCTLGGSSEPAEIQPSASPIDPAEVQPTAPPATPQAEQATSMTDEGESQATPTSTMASLPDQGPIPTGSSQLRATDPDSVSLADGDPTLVEFFAFW
ncbi:MAG: hypothetical protein ACLFWD_04690 [Anaerolineales bacterium]